MAYFTIGKQVHDIKTGFFKIGRVAEKNDLVLSQLQVSREHATIALAGEDQYKLTDLGSSNGTYVNGKKIPAKTAYWLQPGDTVTIGSTQLTFWIGNPEHLQPDFGTIHDYAAAA
jgi:pSer/pThr/pTyr-binding forkhead associated (FHA) protein